MKTLLHFSDLSIGLEPEGTCDREEDCRPSMYSIMYRGFNVKHCPCHRDNNK